jgi:hypothetical protein
MEIHKYESCHALQWPSSPKYLRFQRQFREHRNCCRDLFFGALETIPDSLVFGNGFEAAESFCLPSAEIAPETNAFRRNICRQDIVPEMEGFECSETVPETFRFWTVSALQKRSI